MTALLRATLLPHPHSHFHTSALGAPSTLCLVAQNRPPQTPPRRPITVRKAQLDVRALATRSSAHVGERINTEREIMKSIF